MDEITRISRAEIFQKNLMAQYRYEKGNKSKLTSWEGGSGYSNTKLPLPAYVVRFLGTVSVLQNTFLSPFLGTLEGELSGARKIIKQFL